MSKLIYKNGLWVPENEPQRAFSRPNDDFELPVVIFDPRSLRPEDEEIIQAMYEHPPDSKFRPGDVLYLQRSPASMRLKREMVPRFWEARFVISAFQYELFALIQDFSTDDDVIGIDHAIALLEAQGGVNERNYRRPMVYAHAFPHGHYPDTTMWFPEYCFVKVNLADPTQTWPVILDEAKAPFQGIDTTGLKRPYHLDLAPDFYRDGENIGRPFTHEEATFQSAALVGLEEAMLVPVDPYAVGDPHCLDPDHDIFAQHAE